MFPGLVGKLEAVATLVEALMVVLVVEIFVVVFNVVVVTGEGSVTTSGGLSVTPEKLSRNRGEIIVNQNLFYCKQINKPIHMMRTISYQLVWCVCCPRSPAPVADRWGHGRRN